MLGVLKKIKEDNLGTTNFIEHFMKRDSLHLENCKLGHEAGSF